MDYEGFGFGGKAPVPCSPRAQAIADAINDLNAARHDLDVARRNVPSYTAQWSSEDYYAEEQERFYRAADAVVAALDLVEA